jgi:putative SOS response-associated peptidase YedK
VRLSRVSISLEGVMVPIHDRQPVILEPNEYEEWLASSDGLLFTYCASFQTKGRR